MRAITPFLWFDDNLEEAVAFYTSRLPGREDARHDASP